MHNFSEDYKNLRALSKDELRKLGFIHKPPEEAENGGQPSRPEGSEPDFKKQKLSKPEFDEFMGDIWNSSFDGKAQEGEEYDRWIQRQKQSSKFSPY